MRDELEDSLHVRIKVLSATGEKHFDARDYDKAIKDFHAAWDLLPFPKERWEAALWLLTAIGDAHWHAGRLKETLAVFREALRCPEGPANAFVRLRIGEVCYELGLLDESKKELKEAFALKGCEVFSAENPKYYELIRNTITDR